MKKYLFLDMDGVITDFVGAALRKHGKSIPKGDIRWHFDKELGMPQEDFWKALDYEFWRTLPWTTEGPTILKRLENLVGSERIMLLTSPCQQQGGIDGKISWIRENIPAYKRQFIIGPPKYAMAHANACLIDDNDDNCKSFNDHGGTAVLVPRPWNVLRPMACPEHGTFRIGHVIEQVKQFLGK